MRAGTSGCYGESEWVYGELFSPAEYELTGSDSLGVDGFCTVSFVSSDLLINLNRRCDKWKFGKCSNARYYWSEQKWKLMFQQEQATPSKAGQ